MRTTVLWTLLGAAAAASTPAHAQDALTARDIVERIQKQVAVPWSEDTVDTFKIGNPDTKVTGVATTFMATFDVLQRAVASGKNFIITHEPTFYNHRDETDFLQEDPVYQAKRDYINKHGLIVFRFHDHWHRRRPDGISEGMLDKLGWREQRRGERLLFTLPRTTVRALATQLKGKFDKSTIRVVGDLDIAVTNVALAPGAPGSRSHIRLLERDDVEVLVAGEAPEWETIEYARDAAGAGHHKALILIGHVNSEEAGMEVCAEWLKGFLPRIPVEFLPAGDPFWSP